MSTCLHPCPRFPCPGALYSPHLAFSSERDPLKLVFLFLNLPTPCACNSRFQFRVGAGLGPGPKGCASGYWPHLRGEPCGKTPPFGFAAVLPAMRNRPAMTHFSAPTADVGASGCSPWLPPASPARSTRWAARERLNRVMVTCPSAPFKAPF